MGKLYKDLSTVRRYDNESLETSFGRALVVDAVHTVFIDPDEVSPNRFISGVLVGAGATPEDAWGDLSLNHTIYWRRMPEQVSYKNFDTNETTYKVSARITVDTFDKSKTNED
jgi:hypothetical protein